MKITYEFALFVFFIELIILITLLLFIFARRLISHCKKQRFENRQVHISSYIQSRLNHHQALLPKFSSLDLLIALESLDKELCGEDWIYVKKELAKVYLLPQARMYYKSPFWEKRAFAARIFCLSPLGKDLHRISFLLKDRKFLVQSYAAIATISLESENGIYLIIKEMSKQKNYSYYFYQELLSKSSKKNLSTVFIFAKKSQNKKFHLACLEILSHQILPENLKVLTCEVDPYVLPLF